QAEDGIRDRNVTGVQTCALPILEMRYACDACRDSGYVGELKNQECECRRRRRLQLMRESANLSAHAGETFEQFDPGVFPEGAQQIGRASCRERGGSPEGDGVREK